MLLTWSRSLPNGHTHTQCEIPTDHHLRRYCHPAGPISTLLHASPLLLSPSILLGSPPLPSPLTWKKCRAALASPCCASKRAQACREGRVRGARGVEGRAESKRGEKG